MKICPKCKAEIQGNARFCLYCMTSFEEKQNIEIKKQNKFTALYIIIAVLLAFLIGFLVYYFVGDNTESTDGSEVNTQQPVFEDNYSENTQLSVPAEQNSGQGGSTYNSSDFENYPPSNSQEGYPPNYNSSNVSGGNSGNNSSSQNSSGNNSSANDNSSGNNSSENNNSSGDSQLPSSSENSSSQTSSQPIVSSGSYSYRAAKYGDDYNSYATIPENAIVITKVNFASSNGVYEIPSSIDGKPVIAIMENAFGNVAANVKTVIIPASIRTIWSYGFFYCNNLKELYIKGEALFIGDSPFPPVSRRNETITIYCSATCHNRNFTKWKNIAEYNNAVYKEWNG